MAINREDWLRSVVPAGTVIAFAGATPPTGWLLCNGSAISRTTYSALFAAIGSAHGSGDGSTTFHLPDYRGRFLRGVDGAAGNDPDKLTRTAANTGGNTANAVGSVQSDVFQAHAHLTSTSSSYGNIGYANQVARTNGGTQQNVNFDQGIATGSSSTETRPKNANVNYIIKA